MSKSKNNYIGIFEEYSNIKKRIMKITTQDIPYADSKNPDECAVYQYIKLFATTEQDKYIREKYLGGEFGYGDAKNFLLEIITKYFQKEKEIYDKLMSDETFFNESFLKIEENNKKMNILADMKLKSLKEAVGLS
jgi:tryptophanyl-tRNA synthetase